MEDFRDSLVVIFAGYNREMASFLSVNSGIESRIGYTFEFEDYTAEELLEILTQKISKAGMVLSKEAAAKSVKVLQYFTSVPNFGNGRFAEKLSQTMFEKHAERNFEPVDKDNLLTITEEDVPSIEEMVDRLPYKDKYVRPSKISKEDLMRTAVHELGHAITCILDFPDTKLDKITVEAEGSGALGYVRHEESPLGYTSSKDTIKKRIKMLMAGIAFEEAILGNFDSGGTSDLKKATDLAINMVSKFGMSKNGFVSVDDPTPAMYDEANEILKEAFSLAIDVAQKYKVEIGEISKTLVENGSMTQEEIKLALKV